MKFVKVDLFIGNNLNIFNSKIKNKIYFFANYIKNIYIILLLKKSFTIKNIIL